MSPALDDADRMIAESAREFAERAGGLRRVRSLRDRGVPFEMERWRSMAELGWIGMALPEQRGGLGLGMRHACILLETLGRKLLPEPLATGVAAAHVLGMCDGSPPELLESLLRGETTFGLAPWDGRQLAWPDVPDMGERFRLLVGGGAREDFAVRVVDPADGGVVVAASRCVDGSVLAELRSSADGFGRAPSLATGTQAAAAFEAGLAALRLGDAAYLVGVMDEALRLSVAYLGDRVQFGVPLSSFQALQHRAATCYVDVTASRALVQEACRAFGTAGQARASAAAKARAAAAALRVTKEAVQFHGSLGFADEHDIGLYLRRAMSVVARSGGVIENEKLFARAPVAE